MRCQICSSVFDRRLFIENFLSASPAIETTLDFDGLSSGHQIGGMIDSAGCNSVNVNQSFGFSRDAFQRDKSHPKSLIEATPLSRLSTSVTKTAARVIISETSGSRLRGASPSFHDLLIGLVWVPSKDDCNQIHFLPLHLLREPLAVPMPSRDIFKLFE
ncbi:hypothetical protein PGT21_009878 [Puccinia graminis f. sp. tritici]|uniref:Uncharacterized protein n=1 Tax=Puccinia graminis f. sp. tritici TaxID=56615 RepID=A0A5B0N890_PUCGR|nr:hypothetical protein PGT21_009878 [Puccinia graminis f. sp. tritici]